MIRRLVLVALAALPCVAIPGPESSSAASSWSVDTNEAATCLPYLWQAQDDGLGIAAMLAAGWHTSDQDPRAFAIYSPKC